MDLQPEMDMESYGPPRPAGYDENRGGDREGDRGGERDRGDRGDRDKSDRGDRDRGDKRDRSDRSDRDRSDRDRSDRDRSDRDRDRDRERDRDRGRDDRGSDRGRDRGRDDRDRGHRGERDRDYRGDRDRDRRRSRERRRSRTRSRDRRERRSHRERSPSPLDQDVVPLNKRPRALNNWDVPPSGMEGMNPMQVKSLGIFPSGGLTVSGPGSFYRGGGTPPPMPVHHPVHIPLPGGGVNLPLPGGIDSQSHIYRQAKRLYVGNIPDQLAEHDLTAFFNELFAKTNLFTGDPVVSVQVNREKNFVFVELRTPEEATAGMAFDGINYKGYSLKIRRPKDYQALPGQSEAPMYVPGVISTNVPDSPNKIFIGGLPTSFTDDQVKQLLQVFGELRAFNLVKDPGSNTSKGYAFCEFLDPNVTDIACQALNNMDVGEKKLVMQRASVGAKSGVVAPAPAPLLPGLTMLPPGVIAGPNEATTVLQLLNMVSEADLVDDQEYEDIVEDIRDECEKFGPVKSLHIPRPSPDGHEVRGLGKIFVEFHDLNGSRTAQQSLAGRKFAGRTVITSFISEEKYHSRQF